MNCDGTFDTETKEEQVNRVETATAICAHPELFMFCEACSNVFKRGGRVETQGMCVVCHGYRFNSDPDDVREVARRIASRPGNSVLPKHYV